MLTVVVAVGAGDIPSAATDDDDQPNMLRAGSAVLYWNNPFGTVRSSRAERHLLSHWLSSGECAEVQQPRTVVPGHEK
jgi:hypothetical protein